MPLRIGTSGWQYRHWSGCFYPADLPVSRWLRFYAGCFETVEVDSAFYRLPAADVFARWRDETLASFPEGIRLAVGASRELGLRRGVGAARAPQSGVVHRRRALATLAGRQDVRLGVLPLPRRRRLTPTLLREPGARQLGFSRIARTWPAEADVYAYFNNDACTCAPRDAQRFAAACTREGLLTSRVSPP